MRTSPLRFACALVLFAAAASLCPVRGDDADAVLAKLVKAKTEYETEVQKLKKAVTELLDAREDAARKNGNKKAVDEVKVQRTAFEDTGELPPALPSTALAQVRAAVTKFDRAHTEAIKALVKIKQDAAAETIEKEQKRFASEAALQYGKRTYLTALKVSDVKVWNKFFEVESKKGQVNGRVVPHSVIMHPDVQTYANASFQLDGRSGVFHARVGTPKHDPTLGDPASPLTFEVLADGKSIWKSEPVTKVDTFQTCTVRVEKAKVLTLRVHCADAHGGAHAAWLAPFVAE